MKRLYSSKAAEDLEVLYTSPARSGETKDFGAFWGYTDAFLGIRTHINCVPHFPPKSINLKQKNILLGLIPPSQSSLVLAMISGIWYLYRTSISSKFSVL